jgi:3-methyladenine DNA glycosylase/8-oxoguanine DNA glycosylase
MGPCQVKKQGILILSQICDLAFSYFILLRGLGRMERVSAIDKEMGKAASHIYNNDQPLTTVEMQRLLDRYGAEQGYWAFYIRNATPERAAAMEMI